MKEEFNDLSLRMKKVEKLIEAHLLSSEVASKDFLTLREAARFLDVSQSHLYKLTSKDVIPFYKPRGGRIYFLKKELESWVLRHRNQTEIEIIKNAKSDED